MSRKQKVLAWLKENKHTFTEMTDAEKKHMRSTLNICGAKTQKQLPCCRSPMQNGRCYKHGGATPHGMASANYRGKGFSKYIPKNLVGRYEEFLGDTNLVSLRDEIAITKVRSTDLLQQLNERGDSKDWEELGVRWVQLRAAMTRGDRPAVNEAMWDIERMMTTGAENFILWDKIGKTFELTRRLEATEAKMLNGMRLTITVENGLAFALAIVDVVRRHLKTYMEKGLVVDKGLFSAISADIHALTSRGRNLIDA